MTHLLGRLSKYAPRGHSGKLVTIYPTDERACEAILTELGERLDGEAEPVHPQRPAMGQTARSTSATAASPVDTA